MSQKCDIAPCKNNIIRKSNFIRWLSILFLLWIFNTVYFKQLSFTECVRRAFCNGISPLLSCTLLPCILPPLVDSLVPVPHGHGEACSLLVTTAQIQRQAFYPVARIGPPPPLSARECCSPPHLDPRSETHLLGGEGVGGPNSDSSLFINSPNFVLLLPILYVSLYSTCAAEAVFCYTAENSHHLEAQVT